MGAVAPFVADIVARAGDLLFVGIGIGPLQRRQHLLIGQMPVAMFVVQIGGAVLQENPDRADRAFADQARIGVAAVNSGMIRRRRMIADGGVAADHADDIAEGLRLVPRYRPGADGAAGSTADGSLLGIVGELVALGHLGQHFLGEEAGIGIVDRVIFRGTVV